MRLVKLAWLTFWGAVAMFSIRRLGYQGMTPIEVEGQYFLVLIPNDVELPQGEDTQFNAKGEVNEAC